MKAGTMDGQGLDNKLKGMATKALLIGIPALIVLGVFVGWLLWGGN